jgi:hypothetical protein
MPRNAVCCGVDGEILWDAILLDPFADARQVYGISIIKKLGWAQ